MSRIGSPFRIVLVYALFGTLWILFSDKLMVQFVPIRLQEAVSIGKGWFFIAVTTLLLHILIGRQLGRMAEVVDEARESEALFRSLFEQAAVGVAQIETSTGRFVRVNRRFGEITGYTPEELVKLDVQSITHPDDLTVHFENMHRLETGESSEISVEKRYLRIDGSVVWVKLGMSPLWHSPKSPAWYISVIEDITDLKQTEDELRLYRNRLEVLVEERTRELEEARLALMNNIEDLSLKTEEVAAANERLKEVDRFKSLFIASMSHELRTPLNSVIGFSSILLNEWIGTLNDEQKSGLSSILRSGKHLLSLVNDVIDVSKVEAGMLEISNENFDLAELLAELEETFVKEVQDRGIILSVDRLHLLMRTDRRRLLQCLLNLVSNAIKFTEQGSVSVVVRHDPEQGKVHFDVTDTGVGIREEDQPRLFQAFSRIYSPVSSKVLGTGLGLYLSKKIIIEILHGTISVTSKPGKGSTFAMTIPSHMNEKSGKNNGCETPQGEK